MTTINSHFNYNWSAIYPSLIINLPTLTITSINIPPIYEYFASNNNMFENVNGVCMYVCIFVGRNILFVSPSSHMPKWLSYRSQFFFYNSLFDINQINHFANPMGTTNSYLDLYLCGLEITNMVMAHCGCGPIFLER